MVLMRLLKYEAVPLRDTSRIVEELAWKLSPAGIFASLRWTFVFLTAFNLALALLFWRSQWHHANAWMAGVCGLVGVKAWQIYIRRKRKRVYNRGQV
jgi:hypothetical protein